MSSSSFEELLLAHGRNPYEFHFERLPREVHSGHRNYQHTVYINQNLKELDSLVSSQLWSRKNQEIWIYTRWTGRLRPARLHSVLHSVACTMYLLVFWSFCNVFLLFYVNIACHFKKKTLANTRTIAVLPSSASYAHHVPCVGLTHVLISLIFFLVFVWIERDGQPPDNHAAVAPCFRAAVAAAPTLPSPRRHRAARAPSPWRGLCSSPASRP
jgi:hypothetical protein